MTPRQKIVHALAIIGALALPLSAVISSPSASTLGALFMAIVSSGALSVLPSVLATQATSAIVKAQAATKILMVLAVVSLSGCAWFKANEASLAVDAVKDEQCVQKNIEAGGLVAEDIAINCGIVLVSQVEKYAAAAMTQKTDAGAPSSLALKAALVHRKAPVDAGHGG